MDHRRAGAALFNAGHYLAAHEPLEERWLEAPRGERDACLQGLVQATAAVYKARSGNWSGAVGLAESAVGYLEDCGHERLREWLGRLPADPELAERERPPRLRVDGEGVTPADLQFPAAGLAIEALAETRGDDAVLRAVEYAETDIERGDETSAFVTLTLAYLREGGRGQAVRDRLAQHVERRRAKEEGVEGLFE
jgi:hypothetical protein